MTMRTNRWAVMAGAAVAACVWVATGLGQAQTPQAAPVTAEQAKPFLGKWIAAVDGPPGTITFTIDVVVEGTAVKATVTDEMMGPQKVTGITRRAEALVLTYPVDMMGEAATFTVTLTPEGEHLRTKITVGDGMVEMAGLAKRAK